MAVVVIERGRVASCVRATRSKSTQHADSVRRIAQGQALTTTLQYIISVIIGSLCGSRLLPLRCHRPLRFCRRCGRCRRRRPIGWLLRGLNRLLDDHRSNNVAQHIGKCDDPQQSAFFATLSFFFLLGIDQSVDMPKKAERQNYKPLLQRRPGDEHAAF